MDKPRVRNGNKAVRAVYREGPGAEDHDAGRSSCSEQSFAADKWLTDFANDIQVKAKKQNLPGYTFAYIEKGKPASVVLYGKESKSGSLEFRQTNTPTESAEASYDGDETRNWNCVSNIKHHFQ